MISVTGRFNGKSVKDELVSVEDFMSLVKGSELADALKRKLLYLTYPPNRMEKDVLNDSIRHPASAANPTTYQLKTKDGILSVRYYTNVTEGSDGVKFYEPSRSVSVLNGSHIKGYSPVNDPELMAFLLLSPRNLDSPFCPEPSFALYKIHDHEAIAQKENMAEFRLYEIIADIQILAKENMGLLRRKAMGLVVNGISIPQTEQIIESKEMLIAELMKIARVYPKEFSEKFNQASTVLRGLISEAFVKGTLKGEYEGNQAIVKFNGQEAIRFNSKTDLATGFLDFIQNDGVVEWNTKLSKVLDEENTDAKLNKALAKSNK